MTLKSNEGDYHPAFDIDKKIEKCISKILFTDLIKGLRCDARR